MGNHQGLRPRAEARSGAGGADDENGITEKVTARAVAFSSGVDFLEDISEWQKEKRWQNGEGIREGVL